MRFFSNIYNHDFQHGRTHAASKWRGRLEVNVSHIWISVYTDGTYVGVEVITELYEATKGHTDHQGEV